MAKIYLDTNADGEEVKQRRLTKNLLRTLLLFALMFTIIPMAACDSDSGSGNGSGDGGGDTGGGDGGGDTGGGDGVSNLIVPGGSLPDKPETFSYVEGGSERQTLDYYKIAGVDIPKQAVRASVQEGRRPALVWFHGGGWVINDKTNIEPIAFEVAELAGFHLISVGYRLAGPTGTQEPWPGMMHEVNSAVRWIKQNAEMLGVDPNYVFTTGESAGAHLAAMTALSAGDPELSGSVNPGPSTDVAGAILFYGPYDMSTIVGQGLDLVLDFTCSVDTLNPLAVWALLDCPVPDNVLDPLSGCSNSELKQASPVTHVDSGDPPVFAASGTSDCFVPYNQVFDLQNALNSAGVPNEISVTNGGEHDVETLNVTAEQVVDFIEEKVGK